MSIQDDKSGGGIYLAAVEGGGTSFRVAICQVIIDPTQQQQIDPNNNTTKNLVIPINATTSIVVIETQQYPSDKDPQQCITECCTFFHNRLQGASSTTTSSIQQYAALGVATFGPVGLNIEQQDTTYGRILASTPKVQWRNVNILEPITASCNLQSKPSAVWIETDVNAPAYAEYIRHNNSTTTTNTNSPIISSCAYITVGTGVGVGLVVNDKPVHGFMHPEGGHVCIQPLVENDPFKGYSWGTSSGTMPYNGINTVEAITSSIALSERYYYNNHSQQGDVDPSSIDRDVLKVVPDNDPIWDHAVNAIANLCVTLLLTISIEKIILGGGVVSYRAATLLPRIHRRTIELLNGYITLPSNANNDDPNDDLSHVITTSPYGDNAGLVGAIVLSYRAYLRSQQQQQIDQQQQDTTTSPTTTTTTTKTTYNPVEIKEIKKTAFGHGLWHGIILGVIGTGLIVKYGYSTFYGARTSSSRGGSR